MIAKLIQNPTDEAGDAAQAHRRSQKHLLAGRLTVLKIPWNQTLFVLSKRRTRGPGRPPKSSSLARSL